MADASRPADRVATRRDAASGPPGNRQHADPHRGEWTDSARQLREDRQQRIAMVRASAAGAYPSADSGFAAQTDRAGHGGGIHALAAALAACRARLAEPRRAPRTSFPAGRDGGASFRADLERSYEPHKARVEPALGEGGAPGCPPAAASDTRPALPPPTRRGGGGGENPPPPRHSSGRWSL